MLKQAKKHIDKQYKLFLRELSLLKKQQDQLIFEYRDAIRKTKVKQLKNKVYKVYEGNNKA